MTDSSLSHLPHEINEDIKKLQSDTNIGYCSVVSKLFISTD